MKKIILSILTASTISLSTAYSQSLPTYKNPEAPLEDRVNDLMERMSLEEKILQLRTGGVGRDFEGMFKGKGYGALHEMTLPPYECASLYSMMQNYFRQYSHLGIPAITCAEGIQGIIQKDATLFPHALAQGSTFNTDLIRKMTEAAGDEAEAMGIHQILSPVLDLARELRWGRVEETFGEDNFLVSRMAAAFIDGYQSHSGITCTPKHFVAHGSPSGGLNTAGVYGGERELWSTYIYPFEYVIRNCHPLSIMSCYSAYDGIPLSGSRRFMTDILRDELGFDGYVYSDWGAVERLFTVHHNVSSPEEAARKALIAGIDMNIDPTYDLLKEQVECGILSEEYIDIAVRRVLSVKFRLGLFDKTDPDPSSVISIVRSPENIALAKAVADESAILLQNNGILPLDPSRLSSIAVVGPNANQAVYGDYSWTYGDTDEGINLLQGIRTVFAGKKINYAEGCDWWSQDDTHIKEAVKAVKKSDIAIVAIGTRSTYLARDPKNSTSGEAFDLSDLELPGRQMDLLKAVKATGKPMVVILISGKPLALPWVKDNADAFIVQWYGGEMQGLSLAEILAGSVNPSGRLNVSFPRSSGNLPCFYNYLTNDRESIYDGPGSPESPGKHYVFSSPDALWSFGEGLSYSKVDYDSCRITYDQNNKIEIEVELTNRGKFDTKETVQVYVRDVVSSVATPEKQLKAFSKNEVKAGCKSSTKLSIDIAELAIYNERMQRIVEPGEFEIMVGRSSKEILFRERISVGQPIEVH